MPRKATTVAKHLASLPADRRAALSAVRRVTLENLVEEGRAGVRVENQEGGREPETRLTSQPLVPVRSASVP